MARASILLVFGEGDSTKFATKFEGQPDEGQFEVAGRELLEIAAMLRQARLKNQIQIKDATTLAATADCVKTADEARPPIGAPSKPTPFLVPQK